MLYICFTADHEMFFGKNYASPYEVFIDPTYRLMKVLEQYNIPLCLMTDVCSINRYRELGIDSSYVTGMEEQLITAIKRGHDVQLHIHPQWITSKHVNGEWQFDHTNYSLFKDGTESEKNRARKIIYDGKQYLEDLLKPVDNNYSCIAFRAGGWCIHPEKEYLKALIGVGIRIEASVYCGGYRRNHTHNYDFRRVPSKPNWWIDPEKGINHEAEKHEGNIYEVATGAYNEAFLKIGKKIAYRNYRKKNIKHKTSKPLGVAKTVNNCKIVKFMDKLKNFLVQPILFCYDEAHAEMLLDQLAYYNDKYGSDNTDHYLCIIGHPKALTIDYLEEIDKFCKTAVDRYRNTVRFIRFRDIPIRHLRGATECVSE